MSFDVTKKSIGQLFTGKNFYVLPAYQRPFSWTSKEAMRLLNDLMLSYVEEDQNPYFLGMTVSVLQELDEGPTGSSLPSIAKAEASVENAIEINGVIDGQQRLATLTILLAVLRDLSEPGSEREFIRSLVEVKDASIHPFRLVLFTNDNDIFEHLIQPDGSTLIETDNADLHQSQENILHIRELFKKRLSQMDPDHRSGLLKFIIDCATLICVTALDLDSGYKIFMGINQTGKKLAISDIARALFLGSVPTKEREAVTIDWRQTEEILGEEFDGIFSFIQRIHGRRSEKIISENIAISKLAGGSAPYIKNVVTPLAEALIYIKKPEVRNIPEDHAIHRHLTMLRWIKNDAWIPPAIQFLSSNKNQTDEIDQFLRELHRLVFGLTVMGLGDSKRLTRHRGLIRNIMDSTHWNKSTSKLFLTTDEQKKILYQLTFNLYSSSSQSSKLMLLLLNDVIAGGDLQFDPADISVEHVFPRRPTKRSNWLKVFEDANERDACRSSLGNQIPLTVKMNNKVKNFDYAEKLEIIFPEDKLTGSRKPTEFAITNQLLSINNWDYATVMENEERYLDILKKTLRLEGPSGIELRRAKQNGKSNPTT